MKKTYQSPEALVIKIQINESLLINMSETTVEGGNGGWAKEENNNVITDKNIWSDEW
ncbi:MAG: hypothetical protein IJK51_04310 [Bacteroidaceae bacterium]|nr:hypothetical protein [Bacteroidaceae bacterium]